MFSLQIAYTLCTWLVAYNGGEKEQVVPPQKGRISWTEKYCYEEESDKNNYD